MEDRLITTKEVGNYRIKIYYDTDSICPCESWDMAACFLWECIYLPRLQDVCDWREVFGKYGDSRHSLIDALHKLISEYVKWKDLLNYFKKGKIDGCRLRYDNHDKMWYYKEIFSISPSDLYTYDYTYEFTEDLGCEELIQILSDLGKDIFVKEWSTTGYSQGDYVKGIAFCTKERYTKMVSNNTSDWKTQIDKLIDDEVKSIGMWIWGDVKGYVLEKKVKFVKKYKDKSKEDEEGEGWEEVDSCWDYYMETDELIEEIMKKHNLKKIRRWGGVMRVYYQKEHQRITNNTDSGQRLIVTDATGDRWGKVRRAPVQGRRGLHHMA